MPSRCAALTLFPPTSLITRSITVRSTTPRFAVVAMARRWSVVSATPRTVTLCPRTRPDTANDDDSTQWPIQRQRAESTDRSRLVWWPDLANGEILDNNAGQRTATSAVTRAKFGTSWLFESRTAGVPFARTFSEPATVATIVRRP